MSKYLSPNEFGQISIIVLFITFAMVICDFGLSGALIRKPQAEEDDYATVLFVNMTAGSIVFFILLLTSGYLASYYRDTTIKYLLICAGFVIIMQSFYLSVNARHIRELEFKQRALERLIAVVLASGIAILYASTVGGVWSLMIFQMLNPVILIIACFFNTKNIKIKIFFNAKAFKSLYPFGINTTFSSMFQVGFENIYQFLILKHFSIYEVGYYYQAKKLQDVPYNLINMLTQNVFFANLAKVQHNKQEFTQLYAKILRQTTFILAFIATVMYIYSGILIQLLYGEKWQGTVYYIKLLTVASFFLYIEYIIRLIFKIYDRTKTLLLIETTKKAIQLVLIVLTLYLKKFDWLLITIIINNFIGVVLNYIYSTKILIRDLKGELKYIGKVVLFSCVVLFFFYVIGEKQMVSNRLQFMLISLPVLLIIFAFFSKKLKIWV